MQKNTNPTTYTIDLVQLAKALWKRAWAIILAAVIFGGCAFGYARFLITPLYQSTALMYVNNSSFSVGSTNFSISTGELSAAKTLVSTYIVILKTRSTLETIIDEAQLDYTYEELKAMVSSAPVDNTEIFGITVTSPDPQEAERIANTIARVLPDKISEVVDGSSVRVVDHAVVAAHKSSPNITKITMIGLLLGFVIACAVITVLFLMDDLIHDEETLRQEFDLPVLAVIPELSGDKSGSGKYGQYKEYGGTQNG